MENLEPNKLKELLSLYAPYDQFTTATLLRYGLKTDQIKKVVDLFDVNDLRRMIGSEVMYRIFFESKRFKGTDSIATEDLQREKVAEIQREFNNSLQEIMNDPQTLPAVQLLNNLQLNDLKELFVQFAGKEKSYDDITTAIYQLYAKSSKGAVKIQAYSAPASWLKEVGTNPNYRVDTNSITRIFGDNFWKSFGDNTNWQLVSAQTNKTLWGDKRLTITLQNTDPSNGSPIPFNVDQGKLRNDFGDFLNAVSSGKIDLKIQNYKDAYSVAVNNGQVTLVLPDYAAYFCPFVNSPAALAIFNMANILQNNNGILPVKDNTTVPTYV
ncbi:MAG: hypothetical protein Q7R95_09620, partial [bacterium]|nr:hypothetical protein [bacterium]